MKSVCQTLSNKQMMSLTVSTVSSVPIVAFSSMESGGKVSGWKMGELSFMSCICIVTSAVLDHNSGVPISLAII